MGIKETGLLGRQDKLLTFGATGKISTAGTYACGGSDGVVLDMFNGDTNPKAQIANLEGFSVNFKIDAALTATTAVFKVQVCDTADGTYKDAAVSREVATAELAEGASFPVAVPRGTVEGRYVKAVVVTTGTGGNGVVSACVDTFAGV